MLGVVHRNNGFRILYVRFDFMFNVKLGFGLFLASFAVALVILITGAPALEGHVSLAILCASMFGMGIGASIVVND